MLKALLKLHLQLVTLPSGQPPSEIRENPKLWPFLKGCVGAIDGSHIRICVPRKMQGPWRNRKGWISQNVLAACDFGMNFQFIWPGWEGSAHDSKVLLDAVRRGGFRAPTTKHYYLADAGYSSNSSLTLTPYTGVRYHLKEQVKSNQRPQNKQELFNLRHAQARNVIERCFGVLKQRFRILDRPKEGFSIKTQIRLVFALTALHNFMNMHGSDPFSEAELIGEEELQRDIIRVENFQRGLQDRDLRIRRDKIAKRMWRSYKNVLRDREVNP